MVRRQVRALLASVHENECPTLQYGTFLSWSSHNDYITMTMITVGYFIIFIFYSVYMYEGVSSKAYSIVVYGGLLHSLKYNNLLDMLEFYRKEQLAGIV